MVRKVKIETWRTVRGAPMAVTMLGTGAGLIVGSVLFVVAWMASAA